MTPAGLRSIAVQGDGIAAHAAAIAFRRALPQARVTLAPAERDAQPDHLGAATHIIHGFHARIGLDRKLFERRTGAVTIRSLHLEQEAGAPRVTVRPCPTPVFVDGCALHQLWLRHARDGGLPASGWSALAPAAPPDDDAASFGIRFDGPAYLALLQEMATALDVGRGEAADADLWIDCAARFPAAVISAGDAALGNGETLKISANGATWQTARWSAQFARPAIAATSADGQWTDRTLRIGLPSGPHSLDGQPLAAVFADILRAIELLPDALPAPHLTREYNRRTSLAHQAVADWAAARWALDPPPGLAALFVQFEGRGRLPFRDGDPVPGGDWIGWLLATGVMPRRIDPAARAVPPDRLRQIIDMAIENGREK